MRPNRHSSARGIAVAMVSVFIVAGGALAAGGVDRSVGHGADDPLPTPAATASLTVADAPAATAEPGDDNGGLRGGHGADDAAGDVRGGVNRGADDAASPSPAATAEPGDDNGGHGGHGSDD